MQILKENPVIIIEKLYFRYTIEKIHFKWPKLIREQTRLTNQNNAKKKTPSESEIEDRIVDTCTTNRTYLCSSVTQILCNDLLSRDITSKTICMCK